MAEQTIEFFHRETGEVLKTDWHFVMGNRVWRDNFRSFESQPAVIGFDDCIVECPDIGWRVKVDPDFADTAMGLVDVYAESIRAFDPTEHQIRERANIDHYLRLASPPVAVQEEGDAKDAARYRWLRTPPNNIDACVYGPTFEKYCGGLLRRGEYLDAAIDAAMKGDQP